MRLFRYIKHKKHKTLRDKCLETYGKDFAKKYDLWTMGMPIGDFEETVEFVRCIDELSTDKEE